MAVREESIGKLAPYFEEVTGLGDTTTTAAIITKVATATKQVVMAVVVVGWERRASVA